LRPEQRNPLQPSPRDLPPVPVRSRPSGTLLHRTVPRRAAWPHPTSALSCPRRPPDPCACSASRTRSLWGCCGVGSGRRRGAEGPTATSSLTRLLACTHHQRVARVSNHAARDALCSSAPASRRGRSQLPRLHQLERLRHLRKRVWRRCRLRSQRRRCVLEPRERTPCLSASSSEHLAASLQAPSLCARCFPSDDAGVTLAHTDCASCLDTPARLWKGRASNRC